MIKQSEIAKLEEKATQKQVAREKKRKPKMKVSGKSVLKLKQMIINKE